MSPRITLATAARLLQQLRRDRRSLALIVAVPPLLMWLLRYVFDGSRAFERIGPPLVGMFPLLLMFMITSIAMLRERSSGTLERLMSMPISKLDLLVGYGLAFSMVAAVQATMTSIVAFGLLGLEIEGAAWLLVLLAIGNAMLGMALGLLLSAFATSEFQAMQFMPAFLLPQLVLAGLLAPRDQMARPLEVASDFMPVTYAFDALARVTRDGEVTRELWFDVAIVLGCIALALALGATTLRRRTP